MSDFTNRVSTEYGPVSIELTRCDGPDCGTSGQTEFMVGWLHLEPRGMEVATYGRNPDPLDFCSIPCLKKAVDRMTGSA